MDSYGKIFPTRPLLLLLLLCITQRCTYIYEQNASAAGVVHDTGINRIFGSTYNKYVQGVTRCLYLRVAEPVQGTSSFKTCVQSTPAVRVTLFDPRICLFP